MIHNHGPEEGAGLACNEIRRSDGSVRGACMSQALEDLKQYTAKLAEAYERQVQIYELDFTCEPWEVKDAHGRPVLLDALTALVNAQAVIVKAETQ